MKTIHYIIYTLAVLAIWSCISDDTTGAVNPISEITIDSVSVQEVYNLELNDELTITPIVTQANEDKPLTYTWEIDGEEYSHEAVLHYTGKTLGKLTCRLVVANEDGKAFRVFMLNVNSPYEEGVALLSVDANGKSMLSFMRTDVDEGGFKSGDCFSLNNADETFTPNAADMAQCDGSLIIACSGDDSEVGRIFYLNEKTFIVENQLSTSDYPDFKPTVLGIPEYGASGSSYPILSEDGTVYAFSTTEGALIPSADFKNKYAQQCICFSNSSGFYYGFLWDETVGGLCGKIMSYGPYYCSDTYLCHWDDETGALTGANYFDGYDFVGMFMPEIVNSTDERSMVVIVKNKTTGFLSRVRLYYAWWRYSSETASTVFVDNGGLRLVSLMPETVKYDGTSPQVASALYGTLLYANGRDIYEWVYGSNAMLHNPTPKLSVGSDNAIITSMDMSDDQTLTYVAFYEPDEQGLNGYVWTIATDTGEVLHKYANIGYRPTKILFKKK